MQKPFSIGVLTGGPSLERGISLNSARSLLDHLASPTVRVVPIYFDQKRHAYRLSEAQLYSNTPADFDFQVQRLAKALTPKQLIAELKRCDLIFPAIHGAFGEDGEIQTLLEKHGIPFVGSGAAACKQCFDKYEASHTIASHGFPTLPCALLKIYYDDHEEIVRDFFARYQPERVIVKPATGGSSIGVFAASSPAEAIEKVKLLFSRRMDTRVVLEQFARGIEFTVVVLENRFGLPVAIMPTEVEKDYEAHQIFDYRRKYLPTGQFTFHCPPRFANHVIERIQVQAEQLFALFGMHDFARFDGWVLENGELWFADFNPISGMEQNSFLFQQAARIGLSHRAVLRAIVEQACRRQRLEPPLWQEDLGTERRQVAVLFGGGTSERQVSLMSGTNVWLKLRRSEKFEPVPYLLDLDGGVWRVPYALLLNHTVEEIVAACRTATTHLWYAKLSAAHPDIAAVARAVATAGADGLSLVNTLRGLALDPRTLEPVLARGAGGLSGPSLKPVALAAVHACYAATSLPIVGMGGVMNGRDALELIACGAREVALGTVLFSDPDAPARIRDELERAAEAVGVVQPDDVYAFVHRPEKALEIGSIVAA